MKFLIAFLAWTILFVLCWPLAIIALFSWPIVWLASLPFRLIGITLSAAFALLNAILLFLARTLGCRPNQGLAHQPAA